MEKRIDYQELYYDLIAPSNVAALKGIIPSKLLYDIEKRDDTFCMIAYDDEALYGVCVFFCTETGVFIKYIEVSSLVRRQYIGGALLTASLVWCAERGALAAEVQLEDKDKDLLAFFKDCDFEEVGYNTETYFTVGSIAESPIFSMFKKNEERHEKKAQPTAFIKDGIILLDQADIKEVLKFNTKLTEEDRYRFFINPAVDRHSSVVYLKDGKIIGCILIGKYEKGLSIEYADTEEIKNPKALAEMIYKCYSTAAETYPPDTCVYVMTINGEAEKIIKKLVSSPVNQVTQHLYQLIF